MIFTFKPNIDVSVQIAEKLKEVIQTNIYKPGDKLPSVRKLSESIMVNPNTVLKAYKMLEKEKIIYSISKKGYFVWQDFKSTTNDTDLYTLISMFRDEGYSKKELKAIIDEIYGKSDRY